MSIKELEKEIDILRKTLIEKEQLLCQLRGQVPECRYSKTLNSEEIIRYSRQMIMPQVQLDGQIALKNARVLVVGAGGLGCPAALYLSAAGIGNLTIIDYDEVELSNLHRQILHQELDIGRPKVISAYDKLLKINTNIVINPIVAHANSDIIEEIIKNKFDLVLDCSDNVPTRYLLNDICVLHNIPLVSGSALQVEGQLTVYNYENGPCYRCLFPQPPPANTVTNCGDGGILGPVAGVIGVLQALEAIKIILKSDGVLSGRLLLFDGSRTIFRNVKLRGKMLNCEVCGSNPTIKAPIDYEQFCGSRAHDKVINIDMLASDENITVTELYNANKDKLVIDVRPEIEFEMCHLPNTINIPFSLIENGKALDKVRELMRNNTKDGSKIYVLCRRGNDSQRAVACLKKDLDDLHIKFVNVKGGLHEFSKKIDSSFPVY